MPVLDIQPSDNKMFRRWHMLTEWLINRIDTDEVKRLIEDIEQAANYKVNAEGNIVEADYSTINRNKKELQDKMAEKISNEKQLTEFLRQRKKEIEESDEQHREREIAKIAEKDLIEEALQVVENE